VIVRNIGQSDAYYLGVMKKKKEEKGMKEKERVKKKEN
jgi:hypothetical protein